MNYSWKNLYQELCEWRKMGVHLLLEGRESEPGQITRALRVAEKGAYMRDYIADESGRLEAIGFNRIVRRRAQPETRSADEASRERGREGTGVYRQKDQRCIRTRSGK